MRKSGHHWDLLNEMTVYCEKTKGNECTSTFARYAIGGSAIEDHPPKERAVGDVLFGPGRPQSSTPTALLPAHPGHVEHLAPPVLPLLQPAVPSCKQTQKKLECRMLNVWNRWPRRTRHSRSPYYRALPPSRSPSRQYFVWFFFFFARLLTLVYSICDWHPLEVSHNQIKSLKNLWRGTVLYSYRAWTESGASRQCEPTNLLQKTTVFS